LVAQMAQYELFQGSKPDFVPEGSQKNFGPVWLAVAHTSNGNIIAKASGTTAWYSWGGRELSTNHFSWVKCRSASFISGRPNSPPVNALMCGHQFNEPGKVAYYYAVLANTEYGTLPAKLFGASGVAYFTMNGQELTTNNFSWIIQTWSVIHDRQQLGFQVSCVPGNQTGTPGVIYAVVCHTPQGDIIGKPLGNKGVYPFGGRELTTESFSWLIVPGYQLVQNTGSAPTNAIPAGRQSDATGTLWAAIANTPYGKIPAKATGNTALYSYQGAELTTNDFTWICSNL